MQIYNAWLKLKNDDGNTVPQLDITAAEIIMLERIHGQGAVFDVDPKRDEPRSGREEKARLMNRFNANVGDTMLEDPDEVHIVEKTFPGMTPTLPLSLDDVDGWPEDRYCYEARKRREAEAIEAEADAVVAAENAAKGLEDIQVQSGPRNGPGRPPNNLPQDPAMPDAQTLADLTE